MIPGVNSEVVRSRRFFPLPTFHRDSSSSKWKRRRPVNPCHSFGRLVFRVTLVDESQPQAGAYPFPLTGCPGQRSENTSTRAIFILFFVSVFCLSLSRGSIECETYRGKEFKREFCVDRHADHHAAAVVTGRKK
jgi:hypothetical protein